MNDLVINYNGTPATTQKLKQKQNVKDSEIVRILNKIQIQMDGVYSEIGAVMAYANDNDRFFIERNQF